jgi:putative Mn2+ efflux pump MntP
MLLSILSALAVSVDALFIGLSFGLQKKTRFLHLAFINIFLFVLCFVGYFSAAFIYSMLTFEPDPLVGFTFIALGVWAIAQHFIFRRAKDTPSHMSTAVVGLVMSVEAMLITMGITMIFFPYSTAVIPLSVALAHFGYSALTFKLVRTPYAARIPTAYGHVISGLALIAYGILALLF